MVAPKAETIFTMHHQKVVGIALRCPECEQGFFLGRHLLRVETPADYHYPPGPPDLVGNAGPLGFVARCDNCGFRVEMKGNRLPTVAMLADSAYQAEQETYNDPRCGCPDHYVDCPIHGPAGSKNSDSTTDG